MMDYKKQNNLGIVVMQKDTKKVGRTYSRNKHVNGQVKVYFERTAGKNDWSVVHTLVPLAKLEFLRVAE